MNRSHLRAILSALLAAVALARVETASGQQALTVDQWKAQFFSSADLNNPAVSGDSASPSGDGIPNLLKYAFDLDPTSPDVSGLPANRIDADGKLNLSFSRRSGASSQVSYVAEVSSDLIHWASGSTLIEQMAVQPESETMERVTVRDRTSTGQAKSRFLRLRVVRPTGGGTLESPVLSVLNGGSAGAAGLSGGGETAILNWTFATNDAATVRIERQDVPGGPWRTVAEVAAGAGTFTDTGLLAGQPYSYRIESKDTRNNESVPGPPTSFSAAGVELNRPVLALTATAIATDGGNAAPANYLFQVGPSQLTSNNFQGNGSGSLTAYKGFRMDKGRDYPVSISSFFYAQSSQLNFPTGNIRWYDKAALNPSYEPLGMVLKMERHNPDQPGSPLTGYQYFLPNKIGQLWPKESVQMHPNDPYQGTGNANAIANGVYPAGTFWLVDWDLSIDSDNNNGTDLPDRTLAESSLRATQPKMIAVNLSDSDNTGQPDYAKLTNPKEADMVPMVMEALPATLEWDHISVKFKYAGTPTYTADRSGDLRVWRIDTQTQSRSASDYIMPNAVYTASALGLGQPDGTGQKRTKFLFYVEGLNPTPNDTRKIEMVFLFDGIECFSNSVLVQMVPKVEVVQANGTPLADTYKRDDIQDLLLRVLPTQTSDLTVKLNVAPAAMRTQKLGARGDTQMYDFGFLGDDGKTLTSTDTITVRASDNGQRAIKAVFNKEGNLQITAAPPAGATIGGVGQSKQIQVAYQLRKFSRPGDLPKPDYDFNQYDQGFVDAATYWGGFYQHPLDTVERLKAIAMAASSVGRLPTLADHPDDLMSVGSPGLHFLDIFHNKPPYDVLPKALREVDIANHSTKMLSYPQAVDTPPAAAIFWATCWLYQKGSTIINNPNSPTPPYVPGPWKSWTVTTQKYNGGGVQNYVDRINSILSQGQTINPGEPVTNIWPIKIDKNARK